MTHILSFMWIISLLPRGYFCIFQEIMFEINEYMKVVLAVHEYKNQRNTRYCKNNEMCGLKMLQKF